jgi:hypothetical protein
MWLGVSSPTPKPQAKGPPFDSCPRLLVQYIRSYPPYLEAVSHIRNLRTRHAVVTGAHLTRRASAFNKIVINSLVAVQLSAFKEGGSSSWS